MNDFTSTVVSVKRIADSTVRRLSLYLRYLEAAGESGQRTISSGDLARFGATTSAQVRKDLSFFGSFGKRGLGYSVAELTASLREILGLGQEWPVIIVGAGKIGTALAQYHGFRDRGFRVVAVYDRDPRKIGTQWDSLEVRDIADLESDAPDTRARIAVIATPAAQAQAVADHLVHAGIRAILNFAPSQILVPPDVLVRNVNMALELEGLSFALTNRKR